MPSVETVEEVLIQAGEWRAAPHCGGFHARTHAIGVVVVRWRPPEGRADAGDAVAFVEEYAQILRHAGISATVLLDATGPRVLCVPDDHEPYRQRQPDQLRAAGT